MIFESFSAEDTLQFAAKLAQKAKPGDVYCLSGPLGAGKTVFAQGFAAGLGYTEPVTSPTFTLMNVHDGGRLILYHFDLYRLPDDGAAALEGIGAEDFFYAQGVCLIEWPNRAGHLIPETAYHIDINTDYAHDYRKIVVR